MQTLRPYLDLLESGGRGPDICLSISLLGVWKGLTTTTDERLNAPGNAECYEENEAGKGDRVSEGEVLHSVVRGGLFEVLFGYLF